MEEQIGGLGRGGAVHADGEPDPPSARDGDVLDR